MQTSEIIFQDVKTILRRLASADDATGAIPWMHRSKNLLMRLLPIVISIEQSGKDVSPSTLVRLDSLEQWILELNDDPDFQRSKGLFFLLLELKQFLAILPGYQENLIGKQNPLTNENYVYYVMQANALCEAANTNQNSRSIAAAIV